MWHQLWFVVSTLINFDMLVTSITWQHVPDPPAYLCATLKVGCDLHGDEAIELPQTSYFMLQVNASSIYLHQL